VRREEHSLGEIFSYRFPGEDPDHAVLVLHGIASHGGIYDNFGSIHADKGVDVWCMDAPGHGRSAMNRRPGRFTLEEWVEAAVSYGEHIQTKTGLPVFVKGSSLGCTPAYPAVAADCFAGAVLMGGWLVPGSPLLPKENPFRTAAYEQLAATPFGRAMQLNIDRLFSFDEDYGYKGAGEQKHGDPLNTWAYDMASWASIFRYDPPVPTEQNTKPILLAVGENDPGYPLSTFEQLHQAMGGPVDTHIEPGGVHQLMLFHTDSYSTVVHEWCQKQLTKGK
jgi:pimeloyl-ACP methyl ester carboxylesterase